MQFGETNFQDIQLLLLAGVVLAVLWVFRSPWLKGLAGEWWVRSTLSSNLSETDYTLINDLTLPVRDGTTQIDHVVVSRYGIFVVETKNMSGWIFGSADQKTWTQTLRRHKFKMQNPTHQNYKHVKAVQELLRIEQQKIHNVVAFVGSATPKTSMPPNVVWSTRALITYIKRFSQIELEDTEVSNLAAKLKDSALKRTLKTRRDHVRHIKSLSGKLGARNAKCPRCGAMMVERTKRVNGSSFFGCSKFPKCRGTRQLR